MANDTTARRPTLWSDDAIRYVPITLSAEDDRALILAALAHTPALRKVLCAIQLLKRAHEEPDRLFTPTVWVEKALAEQAQLRETVAVTRVADEDDQTDDDTAADEDDPDNADNDDYDDYDDRDEE